MTNEINWTGAPEGAQSVWEDLLASEAELETAARKFYETHLQPTGAYARAFSYVKDADPAKVALFERDSERADYGTYPGRYAKHSRTNWTVAKWASAAKTNRARAKRLGR